MTERLVVLQSFPAPRPTTNPYLVMLARAVAAVPDVELRTFSWRRALLGRRYDVFHVHWPEILVSGRSPLKKLVRQVLFLLFLLRLRVLRTPIVRTVHNLERPQGISWRERALLGLIERQTSLRIAINTITPIPEGQAFVTIPHGHYRDWFAHYSEPAPVRGRIAYVGLIRRYKGVDSLVRAFRETADPELSLHVSGRPSNDDLAATLTALAHGDARIHLLLRFLSDAELVTEIGESELVVLPYRDMHNSGGALTTLSLDRPVLVPDNEVNRRLADEVGPGWVYTFGDRLTSADLERTTAAVRARRDSARPDLAHRSWERAGIQHVAAYRQAVAHARRRRWPLLD